MSRLSFTHRDICFSVSDLCTMCYKYHLWSAWKWQNNKTYTDSGVTDIVIKYIEDVLIKFYLSTHIFIYLKRKS